MGDFDSFVRSTKEAFILSQVREFCLDNCILSGCRSSSIDATIYYLYHFGDSEFHVSQDVVCKRFGCSCVSLRNNVRKVRQSKYFSDIVLMLGNKNINRRV